MKVVYLLAGITIKPFLRLLSRNQISYTPKTVGRLLLILQSSFWSTLFSAIENAQYARKIRQQKTPADPIFIIGHWRTGSTYLHQLMNLDPLFITPSLFQVAIPEGFLVSRRYYKPVMRGILPKFRPMDNVRLGMDEPQEDEYALFRMTSYSPLERLIFPLNNDFFLKNSSSFLPPPAEREAWEEKLILYFKKLTFATGSTIVSKNPFNTLRIPVLNRLFPKARYIHIIRHPEEVVPSTIHMFDIVQKQNIMNRRHHRPSVAEVTALLDNVLTTSKKELSSIPCERVIEIRYENLVSEPLETLCVIYDHFGFPMTPEVKERVRVMARNLADYQRNKYHLDPLEQKWIRDSLAHHYDTFGYK